MKKMRLIPYTCGAGASTAGCELGPQALKDYGLVEKLQAENFNLSWWEDPSALYANSPWGLEFHDDLPRLGHSERRDAVIWHCAYMRRQVEAVINHGEMPITIGGDHSMAAGSISGLVNAYDASENVGVIWIDAHADINSFETSPSQALHGMPLAVLLGRAGVRPAVLKPEHIFYIGLRDVDPGEQAAINNLGIEALTGDQVNEMGFEAAWQQALGHVQKHTDYLAVSIDLDAFDPAEAMAVGTPVPQGLRRAEAFPALRGLAHQADLIDIVEYNPFLEKQENQTAGFVKDLLQVLMQGK